MISEKFFHLVKANQIEGEKVLDNNMMITKIYLSTTRTYQIEIIIVIML